MLLQSFGKKQQLHDVALQGYFSTQKSDSMLRSPSEDILPVPSCSVVVQWHQSKLRHTGCSPLIPPGWAAAPPLLSSPRQGQELVVGPWRNQGGSLGLLSSRGH